MNTAINAVGLLLVWSSVHNGYAVYQSLLFPDPPHLLLFDPVVFILLTLDVSQGGLEEVTDIIFRIVNRTRLKPQHIPGSFAQRSRPPSSFRTSLRAPSAPALWHGELGTRSGINFIR